MKDDLPPRTKSVSIADFTKESAIEKTLKEVNKFGAPSPIEKYLRDQERMLSAAFPMRDIERMFSIAEQWKLNQSVLDVQPRLDQIQEMIRSTSIYFDSTIARFASAQTAILKGIPKELYEFPIETFRALSDAYNSLAALPDRLFLFPSVEVFNEGRLIDSISLPDFPADNFVQPPAPRPQLPQGKFRSALIELDEELVIPWDGAVYAFRTRNDPDRRRHVSNSLRELITHVLHRLSPNEEITKFSTSPDDFDDEGKPTRRARLAYIYRRVTDDSLKDFVRKDHNSVLEFINVLSAGNHNLNPKFTDRQLKLLLIRTRDAVRFLIEISKGETENSHDYGED